MPTNDNNVSVKVIDTKPISSNKPVRTWYLGENVVEVVSQDFKSDALKKYRKISKEHYVDLSCGEILNYKINQNRSQNINSMRKTIHSIRRIINANFSGGENELFITLTYKDNMQDTKKLYNDFKRFWVNFKKKFGSKYTGLEYINVIEPQERGAWHCHVLVKCDVGQVLYIPNDDIFDCWSHKGWTKTKRINGIDNIGAYLSAYLTDIEINNDNMNDIISILGTHTDVVTKEINEGGNKVSKRFVKGGRLKFYGSMTNIIRCSRGIIKPQSVDEFYSDVKKIVGSRTPNYSKSIAILNADSELLNSITYENYNLKRD